MSEKKSKKKKVGRQGKATTVETPGSGYPEPMDTLIWLLLLIWRIFWLGQGPRLDLK
jgi:hypothetical protein